MSFLNLMAHEERLPGRRSATLSSRLSKSLVLRSSSSSFKLAKHQTLIMVILQQLPRLPLLLLLLLTLNLNTFKILHEVAAINSVLDINGTFPYLIDNVTHKIIEPCNYMDFDNIYTPNVTYKLSQTAQGRNYHLLKAFDFANYFQSDYWHYSNRNDLLRSAEPVANPTRCSQHLNWLEQQFNQSGEVLFKPGEQHINLMSLADSFGHSETGTYYGHGYWLGSYYECKRTSINLDLFEYENCLNGKIDNSTREECDRQRQSRRELGRRAQEDAKQQQQQHDNIDISEDKLRFRYCIGKAHDIDWPTVDQDRYTPRISYKVGLCLPETCETLSFERHAKQLERLMRLNLPSYMQQRISLHDVYCLPDDRSPIRRLPLSARVFLALCATWLTLLVVATCVYSCYKRHRKDLREIRKLEHAHQLKPHCGNNQKSLVGGNPVVVATQQQQQQQQPALLIEQSNQNEFSSNVVAVANGADSELLLAGGGNNYANNLANKLPVTKLLLQTKTDPVRQAAKPALDDDNDSDDDDDDDDEPSLPQINVCDAAGRGANQYAYSTMAMGPISHDGEQQEQHRSPLAAAAAAAAGPRQSATNLSSSSGSSSVSSSVSAWINDSPLFIRILQALSIKETLREFQQPPRLLKGPKADRELRVNLNALDSIKCICCLLVIFGHIIFIHMQHLSNIVHTIELSHEIYPRALIAFFNFVDTFFIISGMLTAYFIFKRFNKRTFSSPLVWLYISLLRLLRLSPVYVLVFWFIKTTSAYISHGPIWDYGTDKNSIKGLCINDHWWKSILYFGNMGTMQPICILPAWSIIVDAQYSLVMPLIIYMIFKSKRTGYLVLLLAIVVSTTKMTLQLANQTAVKTSDMAKIRLHVYPLISRFAAEFYNTAWNRIGPVAIGILGGHMLYLYEIGKIRRWPRLMQGSAFKLVLVLHIIIVALPAIGRFIDDPESTSETDTTIFILSNATIKPIWSIINTILLLRLITDLRTHSVLARLMSHSIWHCLGKLCFTSYLIHYEIILVMLKSRQEGLIDPNWSNVWREFSAVFLISTIISYIIYILYEAPMNKLIMLAFANKSAKLNKQQQQQQRQQQQQDQAAAAAMNTVN